MSLIVKIMSAESAPDDDTRKSHKLIHGALRVGFSRDLLGRPFLEMWFGEGSEPETYGVDGNVYVMNESGKTISSFGYAALPGPPGEQNAVTLNGALVAIQSGPFPADELRRALGVPDDVALYRKVSDGLETIPAGITASVHVMAGMEFLTGLMPTGSQGSTRAG